MKAKIFAAFLLGAVLAGVVWAVLWRQLQTARQELEAERQAARAAVEKIQQQGEEIKKLETRHARMGQELDQFIGVVNSLRAQESTHASNYARLAATSTNAAGDATNADAGKGGLFGDKGMGDMLSKMMKDPAMKEMLRAQQKVMVQKLYGPLAKDLNLPPEQKEKFMELMLDRQMSAVEQAGALFQEGDAGKTEAAKAIKDKQEEADANLKALIGDEKFAQYQDYSKTMGERMQLDQFRQQLEGGNMALQDAQAKALLQAMKEERDKVPPVISNKTGDNPADFAKAFDGDNLEKQFQWQEDLNRRVQERAGQILTPEQLKEFTGFQSQQATMQKMALKMSKELFGSGKSTTPAK